MAKALSLTVLFRANSLNYGEGIANISELKKIHRGNGDVLTFASRQSIRYDIVRLGNEWFDWNLDTVDKTKGTLQFKEDISIENSVEMDLFGYLKTGKKSKKRPAVARLSHAISLESYRSDMEFLNNMGLAERIGESPNLANIEQHDSLYSYTLTIDLAKIGVDEGIDLSADEKVTRLEQLLDIIKLLNRNIRGRQESLAPLFVIGGVYPVANPFFLGRLNVNAVEGDWHINVDGLEEVTNTTFAGEAIKQHTKTGYVTGMFANESDFESLTEGKTGTIEEFFTMIKKDIRGYYGVTV